MNKKILTLILLILILLSSVLLWHKNNSTIEIIADYNSFAPQKPAVIFAAYSADSTVSDYVISYLKALKEITPNIIFITDNPIKKSTINKLKPYVTYLEAKRHGEYDWGSYKRGFDWLIKHHFHGDYLLLTNDSVLLIAKDLKPIVASNPDKDILGITANTDGTYHLQSYFLRLSKNLYTHPAFQAYLNNVKHEKDGLTVAYRYEVPFTQYFESLGFTHTAYIDYSTLGYLPLNDKNCYPLTMLSKHHAPFLKMRTFTNRLNVQEPRRLVFQWLKKHNEQAYKELTAHLKHINSPYLKEDKQ